ncbi:XAC0095 family protein [Dyella caseinilytica]|uniref:XAC0095-like domain-containing protein n=1 Tax=Dyella caseinilytica TaxID=1849581 RepID=A0ABX7GSZ4_9GAMM|nr:hypothetical protein [Dyella caseinilytica]QRN53557.1 hypothetical protein ISN74_19445 [Dyella caseinilytica]GFZ87292.1 hypothetical protein GCM10011408_02490 [Dyella caseinilytica]
MNKLPHDLLNVEGYVLSQDQYDDLCTTRDKLLLMAQFAGTATSNGDHDTILFIRRSLIGRLFGDLSFEIGEVLEAVAKATTSIDHAQAH